MKKYLFATLVACMVAIGASAQRTPHAIGFHAGGATVDLEYQYHYNNKNFLDVTAGIFNIDEGFALQAVYNWNIAQFPDWTPRFATWKLWGGVGAGLGFYDAGDDDDGFFVGPVGTLGFGFTLKSIPLTIGIDYRPMLALNIGNGCDIISAGFHNVGLTMTYRF